MNSLKPLKRIETSMIEGVKCLSVIQKISMSNEVIYNIIAAPYSFSENIKSF